MKKFAVFIFSLLLVSPVLAKKVDITLLQANDVYEITSLSGDKYGGLARVQTVLNRLKKKNKHTYSILAGDFLSPSAIGTAKVNGERLRGKQMVDVFNAMSWDYVILGNHEFDHGKNNLIERLKEAQFNVINSNIIEKSTQRAFENTVPTEILDIRGVKIGIAGLTLPMPKKDFLIVEDPLKRAKSIIDTFKEDAVDIIVFITHQNIGEDELLARRFPEIDLIMGGHEHENIYIRRGDNFTPIAKADANARSIYVHELEYHTRKKILNLNSTLHLIDDKIPKDRKVKAVVDKWVNIAADAFQADGLELKNIVATTNEPLDGLEASVRNRATRLTELIQNSAYHADKTAELSLVNSGSIRIDDVIPPGPISEYDVVRILPFGGTYELYSVPGEILEKALNVGLENRGTGGFLLHANTDYREGRWLIGGKELETDRSYRVMSSTFLMTKGDRNLEFLVNNKNIRKISQKPVKVRQALIDEFARVYENSNQ